MLGIQPQTELAIVFPGDSEEYVEIPRGEEVVFVGSADIPPGSGTITGAIWYYEGDPTQGIPADMMRSLDGSHAVFIGDYIYNRVGTIFPTLKVFANGKSDGPCTTLENSTSVRVEVLP